MYFYSLQTSKANSSQTYPIWQWSDNLSDTAPIPGAGFDSAAVFSNMFMLRNYLESTGAIFFFRKDQRKLLMGR